MIGQTTFQDCILQGWGLSHLKWRWLRAFMRNWMGSLVEWSSESSNFFITHLVVPKIAFNFFPSHQYWMTIGIAEIFWLSSIIDAQDQKICESPSKSLSTGQPMFSLRWQLFANRKQKGYESCTQVLLKMVSHFFVICHYSDWMLWWNWECIISTIHRSFYLRIVIGTWEHYELCQELWMTVC